MTNNPQQGWSTLELVMLTPMIVGLLGLIIYAGQVGFVKLHLINSVDAGARVAAITGCDKGRAVVKASFEHDNFSQLDCDQEAGGKQVAIKAAYKLDTALPFFDLLATELKAEAHAHNEKL